MPFAEVDNLHWIGDRISTALTYLRGHWTQGGATIFTKLNITVPLIEGNLLFWENLDLKWTQKPLEKAYHQSCPVIYGQKIILNKWMRAY